MGMISLVWGAFSILWMLVALIPLLGWGNWFMIPFASIGALIGAVGIARSPRERRGLAKAGLALNAIAIVVGILRLNLGGGLL